MREAAEWKEQTSYEKFNMILTGPCMHNLRYSKKEVECKAVVVHFQTQNTHYFLLLLKRQGASEDKKTWRWQWLGQLGRFFVCDTFLYLKWRNIKFYIFATFLFLTYKVYLKDDGTNSRKKYKCFILQQSSKKIKRKWGFTSQAHSTFTQAKRRRFVFVHLKKSKKKNRTRWKRVFLYSHWLFPSLLMFHTFF